MRGGQSSLRSSTDRFNNLHRVTSSFDLCSVFHMKLEIKQPFHHHQDLFLNPHFLPIFAWVERLLQDLSVNNLFGNLDGSGFTGYPGRISRLDIGLRYLVKSGMNFVHRLTLLLLRSNLCTWPDFIIFLFKS